MDVVFKFLVNGDKIISLLAQWEFLVFLGIMFGSTILIGKLAEKLFCYLDNKNKKRRR